MHQCFQLFQKKCKHVLYEKFLTSQYARLYFKTIGGISHAYFLDIYIQSLCFAARECIFLSLRLDVFLYLWANDDLAQMKMVTKWGGNCSSFISLFPPMPYSHWQPLTTLEFDFHLDFSLSDLKIFICKVFLKIIITRNLDNCAIEGSDLRNQTDTSSTVANIIIDFLSDWWLLKSES